MNNSFKLSLFGLLLILFSSCSSPSAKATATAGKMNPDSSSTAKAPLKAVIDSTINHNPVNTLNDIVHYLAGMKTDSSAAIPASLLNLPFYKLYRDSMNRGFDHIETIRLSKMREWAKTEMAPELAAPRTVFYPFSGPDILHCIQFYPDADQYIMLALEKPGAVPSMNKMDAVSTKNTLSSILKSLEDIFGKSYFITRKMMTDVDNSWNGVAPVAAVFLARSDYNILDIKYKQLHDDGAIFSEITADSLSHCRNSCVEIYFQKKGSEKISKIVYFRTNLCDSASYKIEGFKDNKPLQAYLNNLPDCYTYLKSASYLMSYKNFSIIREICLRKSKSILQDDTGIALKYLDKNKWDMHFYGNYVSPVKDFSGVYQEELHKIYSDTVKVKPLPFSLGYHWASKNTQNLMKFVKK